MLSPTTVSQRVSWGEIGLFRKDSWEFHQGFHGAIETVPLVSTSVDFTNDDSEKFLRLFLEQIAERTRMAELRPEPVLGGHLARGKSRKVLFVQNPFIARF